MAPDINLPEVINELLKIRSRVDLIENVDQLVDVRQAYSDWYFNLLDKLNNEEIISLNFEYTNDQVMQSVKRGGVGTDFNSPQAQRVLTALNHEIHTKLSDLKKLLNSKNFLIKKNGDFYFMDKVINIKSRNRSYQFLEAIYKLHSGSQTISYISVAKELGISTRSDKVKIISNARDNVFGRHKLIEKNGSKIEFINRIPSGKKFIDTVRGVGFILNNTP